MGSEMCIRDRAVLGANRTAETPAQGVLGAKRTKGQVLGARRGAQTGDAANIAGNLIAMAGSASGMFFFGRRRNKKNDEKYNEIIK